MTLVVICMTMVLQPSLADQTDLQQRIQDTLARYQQINMDAFSFDSESVTGFDAKNAIQIANALTSDISGVIADIQQAKQMRKENNDNYEDILGQVKRVIIDINETKKTVYDAVMKINLYNKDIAATIQSLQQAREYIINAKKSLTELIKLLYLVQNDYYAGSQNIDDIKLLLKSDNISDTLSADDIMNSLIEQFNSLIDDLTEHQKEYTEQYEKMTDLTIHYKTTVVGYQKKMSALQEQKAYLLDFLQLYK